MSDPIALLFEQLKAGKTPNEHLIANAESEWKDRRALFTQFEESGERMHVELEDLRAGLEQALTAKKSAVAQAEYFLRQREDALGVALACFGEKATHDSLHARVMKPCLVLLQHARAGFEKYTAVELRRVLDEWRIAFERARE